MEHIIDVTIKDKVASCSGARYVCGNSDYVIHFDFDDEWTEFETKTARFKCEKGYVDVVFSGDVCAVPVITDTDLFSVGVYAGNIHTTTPAYVRAYKSILCGDMGPYDPPDDVYHQIMDILNHIEKLISEYTLTQASSDEIGGVKADAAEATDTQPVRIGEDGKLYTAPGGGVSGDYIPIPDTAEVGQTIAVKAVDENGKPTAWKAAEIPAVDSTMTQSGQAADAAVVGNRLSELSEEIITTAESKVAAHNAGTDTHSDIRLLIQGLTDRLNALADSDDATLDQLSEIVAYIKSNKSLIDAITTSKVGVADIVDDLTTNVANKPLSAAQGVALKALIDAITVPDKLPNPNALTFTGAVTGSYDGSAPLSVEIPSGGGSGSDISLGLTGATVGQIAKITAVDDTGKPTAWEAADMPSGGGHWETVLDTVWEQDVINPTAFDSETGIFTCAEGELDNLALDTEYVFFQQCAKEGAAYNTILGNENLKVTKLSDTTFSIDVTPPTTFVPTNVKFSRGACLAITDIDAKKIRLTLDGQFKPTATLYDKPFYGIDVPFFGKNTGYHQIRNAYQAYQQVTAEVESPYRIVGEILCGFNAPSQNASFHFKNNSFCCPLIPYDVPEVQPRNYFLTSDGTKIAKLYSSSYPWHLGGSNENIAISTDYLKIISGTKVKLERWVK